MKESTLYAGRLFGVGGASTHSYYGCVIGCGNENYIPTIDHYANPDTNSDPNEYPLPNYYETNFVKKDDQSNILKDQNGNNMIDVNLDLYPGTIKGMNQMDQKESILDTTGGQ